VKGRWIEVLRKMMHHHPLTLGVCESESVCVCVSSVTSSMLFKCVCRCVRMIDIGTLRVCVRVCVCVCA